MAAIDLPYLHLVRSKGRVYTYYRRGALRARIEGEPGTAEFLAAYQVIHAEAETKQAGLAPAIRTVPGSLRALWLAYKASNDWRRLKGATQVGYVSLIEPLLPKFGDAAVSGMKPAWIQRRMDEMTAARANRFLAVIRLLMNWSVPRGWVKVSPAAGIRRAKHKAQSHRIWTAEEIAAMTGPEAGLVRLPILIALHTGQRLGDVLRLTWSAYDGATVTITAQGKTGTRVVVPALPALREALNGAERRAEVVCTRKDGHAWKERHFKATFAAARKRLELPDDLHFHGLRHSAAVRLAEAGCSPHEIAAVTGHKSLAMVSRYTQQVQQEQLAGTAMARLENKPRKEV